ncbi:MAG TPA: VWA domain-containing protein [Acidobacteriaceae bacterium]
MIHHRSVVFSCLGILLLNGASSAGAQTASESSATTSPAASQNAVRPVPLFKTNANLVVVDVVVRDKGEPVHDLRSSDFHLFEDGHEQKVTIFEEHRSTDALRVSAPPPDLPPNTWSDAPRYAVTSAANVLLLDALNTPLSDQVYIRRRMIQYLRTIPPGTRIAVFTLGSHLRIIEGFTTNSSTIEKAMAGRGNPEKSPVMDPDWDQTLGEAANLSGGVAAQAAMTGFAAETQSFESLARGNMTFDAMHQLAGYLATIPGRKNLVWFTGSVPFSLMTGSNPNQDQMADLQDQAKKLMELLTLARVALYPVDARGLLGTPGADAQSRVMNPNLFNSTGPAGGATQGPVPSQAIANSAGLPGQTVSQVVQQRDQAFLEQTTWDHLNMDQFAKATGGKAFINTNALGEALGEAIANGADYYTLAYAPENHNYNNDYRKIEVRIPEEHYDLAYRRGYFALDPAKQDQLFSGRRSPLIDAMQHGVLPLSQLPFQVRVVPATDPVVKDIKLSPDPAGGMAKTLKPPLLRYVADFTIDPAGLDARTLPDGRRHTEIELTQVAYDAGGTRENYADVGLGVDTPPTQEHDGIHLHQEIDLPAGHVYLRIGVHDLISGRIGTVEVPLTVAKQ